METKKVLTTNNRIEAWKRDVLAEDRSIALDAIDRLTEIGGEDIYRFAIELLRSPDPSIRNIATLILGPPKDNRATDPLLEVMSVKKANSRACDLRYRDR
jgi:HEAT repeat protein